MGLSIVDPPGHRHSAKSLVDFNGEFIRGEKGEPGEPVPLPANIVVLDPPSPALFGAVPKRATFHVIAGLAPLNFKARHAGFAMPEGTQGIVSFHFSLLNYCAATGVNKPTDASSVGLLADVPDGLIGVSYQAIYW